jgi:Flp pilus assembly protein TadG
MKKKLSYSGQSLIEFALIIPTVLFLIIGFFDLGRAVFNYSTLTNAVREAARYAIVHKADLTVAFTYPDNNSLQDKVMENALAMELNRAQIVVTVSKTGNSFSTVAIKATYLYQPITPGIKSLLGSGGGINLMAQTKMSVASNSR